MSVAQAGRCLQGRLAQHLLSFPQGEVIWRDGNMSVLWPQAGLGGAQGHIPSLHDCKPLVDLVLSPVATAEPQEWWGKEGEKEGNKKVSEK